MCLSVLPVPYLPRHSGDTCYEMGAEFSVDADSS